MLQKYLEIARTPEKKQLLQDQHTQSNEGFVQCPCGLRRALTMAFRCLYCGVYFCHLCAEVHFGMTIKEWIVKRDAGQACSHEDILRAL